MGLFRKKNPTVPKGPVISHPLAVVPLMPTNVEVRKDSQGMIHLKMTPPLKPFKQKVAKWLNYDYCLKLELDEYGTFFYSLIDGQHTLIFIIDAMSQKFGQSRKETAQNVVAFTKSLMTRNMLVLMVPEKSFARGES